jgi:hypothetical protein
MLKHEALDALEALATCFDLLQTCAAHGLVLAHSDGLQTCAAHGLVLAHSTAHHHEATLADWKELLESKAW